MRLRRQLRMSYLQRCYFYEWVGSSSWGGGGEGFEEGGGFGEEGVGVFVEELLLDFEGFFLVGVVEELLD